MKIFFVSIILLTCIIGLKTQDSCKPLWPRLQFGNTFANPYSQEKLIIRFNTRSECSKSFALIQDSKMVIRKVYCVSSEFKGSQKMGNYTTYIQRCSIEQIDYVKKIQYFIYGSNSSTLTSVPFSTYPITTSVIDPKDETVKVKLIFLGDWGQLHKKLGRYTSINQTLDKLHQDYQINGVIINGDIAYDLDSNQGRNYEQFLALFSRIGRFIPIYTNTGNHEHNSQQIIKIYNLTFQQYGKNTRLATGLNLGSFYLIGFDPYQALYDVEKNQKIQTKYPKQVVLNFTSYKGLHQQLQLTKNLDKQVITSSHYPIMCSGDTTNCEVDTSLLQQYIELMFEYDIKFYMGAHFHTYQRIYPYCANGSIQMSENRQIHLGSKNCFVSIVEGIAGNDNKIIQDYKHFQDFTAAASYNKTGVGLLTIGKQEAIYEHYSSVDVLTLQDQVVIYFNRERNPQLRVQ